MKSLKPTVLDSDSHSGLRGLRGIRWEAGLTLIVLAVASLAGCATARTDKTESEPEPPEFVLSVPEFVPSLSSLVSDGEELWFELTLTPKKNYQRPTLSWTFRAEAGTVSENSVRPQTLLLLPTTDFDVSLESNPVPRWELDRPPSILYRGLCRLILYYKADYLADNQRHSRTSPDYVLAFTRESPDIKFVITIGGRLVDSDDQGNIVTRRD